MDSRILDPKYAMLAKVATIVPIAHLPMIAEHDRFMALVHLLDDHLYNAFYKARVDEGKWVILDNSTVELGEPYPMEKYIPAAIRLGASEILLPDWLFDKNRTLEEADVSMDLAGAAGYEGRYMGVPQGATQEEWIDCLRQMLRMDIWSIGISRRYWPEKFGMSRLMACYTALAVAEEEGGARSLGIHLLGAGLPAEMEVAPCLRLPWVIGVDSAMPSYFSKAGQFLNNNAVRPKVQRDLREDSYPISLMQENVNKWRELCVNE